MTKAKLTACFISLGCPKNLVDTEIMMGILEANNFTIVPSHKKSTVCIINTCSFIGDAKEESIDVIFETAHRKEKKQCEIIVVAGCMPQRYKSKLAKLLPEVDLFIGTGDHEKLPKLILDKLNGKKQKTFVKKQQFLPEHHTPRIQSTPFHTRFVKISEGCSHGCRFCIIPSIRGNLISRKSDDVIKEIKLGIGNGVKEFNLVAQDLNEYGRDLTPRDSLTNLLDKTANLKGNFWLRLMYMYPLQFPDKLITVIKNNPHIAKYVDIPLQHISEPMLKRMNRGSSSRYIYRLIDKLKKEIPSITLRTTFITGHPGETKKDHEELKKFISQTQFDHVGIFKYSNEEDTKSFNMPHHISEELMTERYNELMSIQKKISLKNNKKYVGKKIKVLFTGSSKETELLHEGRHQGQAPDIDGVVLINSGATNIGNFCTVKITQAFEYDLLGEIV